MRDTVLLIERTESRPARIDAHPGFLIEKYDLLLRECHVALRVGLLAHISLMLLVNALGSGIQGDFILASLLSLGTKLRTDGSKV